MRILHTSQPRPINTRNGAAIRPLIPLTISIPVLVMLIMPTRRQRRRLTNRTSRHSPVFKSLLLNPLTLKIPIRTFRFSGIFAVDSRVLEGFDELEFDDG